MRFIAQGRSIGNVLRRMGWASLVCAGAACAHNEERAVAAAAGAGIESCVDDAVIRLRTEDRFAILETAETGEVGAAIGARYPVVRNDGLLPQVIVLWKRPQVGWVYVALLVSPSTPRKVCFTGTFSADRFYVTPRLVQKYFGASARGD